MTIFRHHLEKCLKSVAPKIRLDEYFIDFIPVCKDFFSEFNDSETLKNIFVVRFRININGDGYQEVDLQGGTDLTSAAGLAHRWTLAGTDQFLGAL